MIKKSENENKRHLPIIIMPKHKMKKTSVTSLRCIRRRLFLCSTMVTDLNPFLLPAKQGQKRNPLGTTHQ